MVKRVPIARLALCMTMVHVAPSAHAQTEDAFSMGTCAGYLFAITRWNSENPSNGEAGPIAKDPFDVEATRLVELAASRLHSGDPNALTDFIAMERLRLYNLYNDSIFEDTDLAYAQQDEFDEVGEYCDAAILELPEMQRLLQ